MAEDIREDQMTVANSMDYVRALKGEESVLIKKDDLARLIGAVTSGISISDLDKIERSGLYSIGNECENVPSQSGQLQGSILFHLHWDTNSSRQLYFAYNGAIFYRFKVNSWSSWKSISFT